MFQVEPANRATSIIPKYHLNRESRWCHNRTRLLKKAVRLAAEAATGIGSEWASDPLCSDWRRPIGE